MTHGTTPVSARRGRDSEPAGTAPGAMTDDDRPVVWFGSILVSVTTSRSPGSAPST